MRVAERPDDERPHDSVPQRCLEQGSAAAVEFWINLELCGLIECLGEADYDQCVTDVSSLSASPCSGCYDEAQQ